MRLRGCGCLRPGRLGRRLLQAGFSAAEEAHTDTTDTSAAEDTIDTYLTLLPGKRSLTLRRKELTQPQTPRTPNAAARCRWPAPPQAVSNAAVEDAHAATDAMDTTDTTDTSRRTGTTENSLEEGRLGILLFLAQHSFTGWWTTPTEQSGSSFSRGAS